MKSCSGTWLALAQPSGSPGAELGALSAQGRSFQTLYNRAFSSCGKYRHHQCTALTVGEVQDSGTSVQAPPVPFFRSRNAAEQAHPRPVAWPPPFYGSEVETILQYYMLTSRSFTPARVGPGGVPEEEEVLSVVASVKSWVLQVLQGRVVLTKAPILSPDLPCRGGLSFPAKSTGPPVGIVPSLRPSSAQLLWWWLSTGPGHTGVTSQLCPAPCWGFSAADHQRGFDKESLARPGPAAVVRAKVSLCNVAAI
ncbi:hypothetical protein TREES_T100014552 [Tupaia chinensis]|uniref:Uncharacterized protein n=1 Tax=Tupaia chinensis TaxID=246437 RepID=L9LBL1_TUPCH|nr:hypothetical protein TREES_T100014552 [Tupaia chinensis]